MNNKDIEALNYYIKKHKHENELSFNDYVLTVKEKRRLIPNFKRVVTLDTMAWKCLADYRQKKASLTMEMIKFCESMDRALKSGNFLFPISVPIYFELDSMTDPSTQKTLDNFIDEFSNKICFISIFDRIESEVNSLIYDSFLQKKVEYDFFCSPIEMMGIPKLEITKNLNILISQDLINKAFFDFICEKPFSFMLDQSRNDPGMKWDNEYGLETLNGEKLRYQSLLVNLNSCMFVELKGIIESHFIINKIQFDRFRIVYLALKAINYWKENPFSKNLPTLRILSNLHGLMLLDKNRRYKKGDQNDFQNAALALPASHAFFTDKKLRNLILDNRINISNFTDCSVISGFENMAKYLNENMSQL